MLITGVACSVLLAVEQDTFDSLIKWKTIIFPDRKGLDIYQVNLLYVYCKDVRFSCGSP